MAREFAVGLSVQAMKSASEIQKWVGPNSIGLVLAVVVVAVACVAMVALVLRGTDSSHRADVLRALADVIRALWFGRGPKVGQRTPNE
jgi:hypothetical protein